MDRIRAKLACWGMAYVDGVCWAVTDGWGWAWERCVMVPARKWAGLVYGAAGAIRG